MKILSGIIWILVLFGVWGLLRAATNKPVDDLDRQRRAEGANRDLF